MADFHYDVPNTITYHHRDLVVVLFSKVDQVEVVVEQVFQAAVEVPVGQDGFLQSVALDSSQTELHEKTTQVINFSLLRTGRVMW